MRNALLAALCLTQIAARPAEPVRAVIPVHPARPAGVGSQQRPGSLPGAAVQAHAAAPAGAVKAAGLWAAEGARSVYADGQLVLIHQLSADAALAASDRGEVALAIKGAGDAVFDLRRDQLAQQWPAAAAVVAREAALPALTKDERRARVLAAVASLLREHRAPAAADAPARGEVRLDAELAAPLGGVRTLVELAFDRAADAASFGRALPRLLDGYDRAVRAAAGLALPPSPVVDDVTRLNPVAVEDVAAPETLSELAATVAAHPGAIAVGGGRFSMGGQTASEGALQIDMRRLNKVLAFDPVGKKLTVQAGITWRDVQRFIDPHGLSVKVMQTYADFTVGGALSVNAHGRYMGLGPVILSVEAIKVVLADGSIMAASPKENPDVFYAAIGGYGGLGVIAEATLSLAENKPLEESISEMPASEYKKFFFEKIRNSASAVFHNADLRPPYDHATAVTYFETDKPVTVKDRLRPTGGSYGLRRYVTWAITERPWGQVYRRMIDRIRTWLPRPVLWRNYEASYDVMELEPRSRAESTYVLQEYFVPVERFDEFRVKMAEILNRHKVNALNVSVRHAKKDPGSLLAWAREESFAFVLYYKQKTTEAEKGRVAVWTRELIDAALDSGGRYYLPYQLHATPEQFRRAYPGAEAYARLKKTLDPTGKFTNKLWDKYLTGPAAEPAPDLSSAFKTVYGSTRRRDAFYKYLQNIFHMYPEEKLHQLIAEETARRGTDEAIYEAVQARLKEIRPALQPLRYALPALAVQKREMADQTKALLGERAERPIDGYLEFGTLGRYVAPLKQRLPIKGPVYVVNDRPLGWSPEALLERGGLRRPGTFVMNKGGPIKPEDVPDASVDLVTVYPGLHHFTPQALERFFASLWRVLRPGGRLIVRDHDVDSPEFERFAALVHDVYNMGVMEPWEVNRKEIRHFTSVKGLEQAMIARGFRSTGKRGLQPNDPTRNTLLEFEKIDRPGEPASLAVHRRRAADTFLTVPEWYIVYASREYAKALEGRPSAFNYLGAVTQYWGEYRRAVRNAGDGAWNFETQSMLLFIGLSHSAEFLLKGAYENTLGRVGEWLSDGGKTEEDAFARRVNREYVDFIDHTPWYLFPYKEKLAELDRVPREGRYKIRKLARRLLLKAELGFKARFADFTRKSAEAAYAKPSLETLIVAPKLPDEVLAAEPRLKLHAELSGGRAAYLAPRYGPFTSVAARLADLGVSLESVAGNAGPVAVTALVPRGWTKPDALPGEVVGDYTLLMSDDRRLELKVPAAGLTALLRALKASGAALEHVYDF